MRRLTLLCSALLLAWSHGAPAQVPRQLVPGARVRISESHSGAATTETGTLVAIRADTLVLQPEHRVDTLRIPVGSVRTLEVSRGRKSRVGAGIGYGALVGVATGALVPLAVCGGDCGASSVGNFTGLLVVGGAVLGAVAGSVVGGVIGAAHSGERWEQVPSDRWHLSVAPRPRGGVALAVSVPF
jgi:hypothetical protein